MSVSDVILSTEAVEQLVGQGPEGIEVLTREMIVALRQYADKKVVAKMGLELVCLHEHWVALNEIVVERSPHDQLFHAH